MLRVSQLPGVGRLEIREDAGLNLLETLHDDDAVEHLRASADRAAAVTAVMRALHEQGWTVKVSGGLGGDVSTEAFVAASTLGELEASAHGVGVPAGTLIEWGPGYDLDAVAEQRLLAQAGLVLGGPRFDPPPAGWVVSDPDGIEHLCADNHTAHAQIVEAIDALAVRLARQFPDSDDIIQGLLDHKQEVELEPRGLHLGLVEIGEKRLTVRALPANYFRWEGFKHGIADPDRPDMLDGTYLGWGTIARDLVFEGFDEARRPG